MGLLTTLGIAIYWSPRILIPILIIWGTFSHIVYTLEISNFLKFPLSIVGGTCGFFSLIAYTQVWVCGPGTPLQFEEFKSGDLEQGHNANIDLISQDFVECRYDGSVRKCKHCLVYKPDRTHHCRQCGFCVLRMDHHCPWFSCCIGLHNHKFFIQFLFYVFLLCFCAVCVGVPYLYNFFKSGEYQYHQISKNKVVYTVFASMFTLILLFFGGYSTMLVCQNRTTLESMESVPYKTSLPASMWRYRRPPSLENLGNVYDISVVENINQLFGLTWMEWLLPVVPKLPLDGSRWPFNKDLMAVAEERAKTERAMLERKRTVN